MNTKPVELHIVSWNRPKMTELVIRTIHRNTAGESFKVCVLDNGSNPSTVKMLSDLRKEGLIDDLQSIYENKGLEWARQKLLKHTTTSFFVDIDNDCLPPEGWLGKQLALMDNNSEYVAISQRTPVMIGTGNIFEEADNNGNELVDFPHPGGSFRLMQTAPTKEVGGWNRNSPGRGSEERLICGKLREAGHKTAFATNIQCLHLFGTSDTDYWGYDKSMKPQDSGHSPDVWHPVFAEGDVYEEVVKFAGEDLAREYFDD